MLANLPNLLTLSRIAAIPVLVALVAWQHPGTDVAACALFIAAALTDWLDGKIARAQALHSDLGRMLDPIADKLLVGATLMILAGKGRLTAYAGLYPAIVIMCREILVSGLREYLATLRVGLPVTRLAKWKTALQMTALAILLAGDSGAAALRLNLPLGLLGSLMLWAAALLTLVTGWDYLMAGLRHAVPSFAQAAPMAGPASGPATPSVERLQSKAGALPH